MKVARGCLSAVLCFFLFTVLVLLGIIITLDQTILSPDFVIAELDKLDIYSTVIEQAKAQLLRQEFVQQFISTNTLNQMFDKLQPWLEEQANIIIHGIYAYFHGDQKLDITISLQPVRSIVKETMREVALQSPPLGLEEASQSQIEAFLSQIYVEIDKAIPASFTLDTILGQQTMAQLQDLKQVIHYIGIAYRALIGLAVLLLLLITLVHWWQPKPVTRVTGIVFIIAGMVCVLGSLLDVLVAQAISHLAGESGRLLELQTKVSQFASDLTAPAQSYGIAFLGAGIALALISIQFRPSATSNID